MCSSNGSVAAPHSPVPNRKGQDLKSPGVHIIPLLKEFGWGGYFKRSLVTHLK